MTGTLAFNVMYFARMLRRAGFPIGPGQTMTALAALQAIDLGQKDDVYWALHAALVDRHARSGMFRFAFERFWRATSFEAPMAWPAPARAAADSPPTLESVSVSEQDRERESRDEPDAETTETLSWSAAERLRAMDFEAMSAEERAEARRMMALLRLPIPAVPTRRFHGSPSGSRIDMRATLRKMVRAGGVIDLQRRRRASRHPPLVVLCDISGSMASYARMLLHFLHVITNDRDRVHTFLFGTRLTNVTREMAHRDPDVALARVSRAARDWSGGTRIGQTLATFNRLWSRRVLGQGAVVLVISDGLDRDGGEGLSQEMERLQHSCRRLIWLNPLLRYEAFEPKSAGIRAMLPYVDDFRPVHNIDSLASLVAALGDLPSERLAGRQHKAA
ncbi:MAG: VWA domain-containing protein [Rhodospirillaceae bacterium]|nr:MAG: VWA domain-containing protein [Rhodospirillaceae bacterium]